MHIETGKNGKINTVNSAHSSYLKEIDQVCPSEGFDLRNINTNKSKNLKNDLDTIEDDPNDLYR